MCQGFSHFFSCCFLLENGQISHPQHKGLKRKLRRLLNDALNKYVPRVIMYSSYKHLENCQTVHNDKYLTKHNCKYLETYLCQALSPGRKVPLSITTQENGKKGNGESSFSPYLGAFIEDQRKYNLL